MFPTLTDVGAVSFLADSMKLQIAHDALDADIVGAARCFHLEPTGFACSENGGLSAVPNAADLNQFHSAS